MMLLGMVDLCKPSYDFNLIIVYETHGVTVLRSEDTG